MNQQNIRPQSNQRISSVKQIKHNGHSQPIDIIQQTRKLVKGLDLTSRFRIAQIHLLNAFNERAPRLDTYSPNLSRKFRFCYYLQTSNAWKFFLLIISYIYMYLIIWGQKPTPPIVIFIEILMLFFGWVDVIMQIYHKKFEVLRISSRFQLRFYIKTIILMILVLDEVIVIIAPEWRIRPFILFRCLLPLFYDANVRKAFEALLSSYKDILVFLVFYSFVILSFAIIAHQIIQLPRNADQDPLSSDYNDLGKTIFTMYILATYDGYPDNQMVAIRTSSWIYAFFICFIILNVFFFVNIPVALVYNSFKETRSKIIIIDQIKEQHSLIMSFVSLGQENLTISRNKLIRFLLYIYKNKVRYIDQIVAICRQLDEHNNGVVHVNQYMQLCKILKSDRSMNIPKFYDWKRWTLFRQRINSIFGLQKLVLSDGFKICSCFIIIVTFINATISLYTSILIFDLIDDIFIMFFVCEIILKFIGLGIQQFFRDPWNKLDAVIILLGFIFQLVPNGVGPHNADLLFKMARIFRIGAVIKIFQVTKKKHHQIYQKATRLISQTAIIIPTILKFFPFFLVTFYVISVAGMSIFEQNNIVNTGESPYGAYDDYSNFRSFIGSHILLIQILVEAQWSILAYHYIFKFGNYGLIMLFFVFTHIIIVTIISNLLKGVIWQVYNALNDEFYIKKANRIKIKAHQQQMQRKREQIQQIKAKFNLKQHLVPDNLIVKKLYQNKIDNEILNQLRQTYKNNCQMFQSKKKIKISHIINTVFDQFVQKKTKFVQKTPTKQFKIKKTISKLKSLGNSIDNIQDLQQQDIEDQMQKMLGQIILTHKIKFSATIAHPKVLLQFIIKKFHPLQQNNLKRGFNIKKDIISNRRSVQFLTHGLNALLDIQITQREQKALIIQNMVKQGMITASQSEQLFIKKPIVVDQDFDSNWMMRKAFLSNSNSKLINKFQIEYFSDVYGRSFKQINKVTLQPLLKLQSKLTYCLRNALRYKQINLQQFFILLTTIQDMISNKLLKKGSLFKFVYQIDSAQYWFSIEHLQSHQMRLHFVKNGIWVQNKYMKPDQIYAAEDVFHWENIEQRPDRSVCEKYIKMFYQSFESLAFCIRSQDNFFQSDPIKYKFDLFGFYRSVKDLKRVTNKKISISKIMLVILSKQDERTIPLDYSLSDIKFDQQKQRTKRSLRFKFDQSESETLKKLKRMQLMDFEKLVENQGIPFPYIVNLIKQIQEIVSVHQNNFVYQLEQLFNQIFDGKQPIFDVEQPVVANKFDQSQEIQIASQVETNKNSE